MCVSPTCGMQEGLKQVAHCMLVKIVEFTSIFTIVRLPHTPTLSDICSMKLYYQCGSERLGKPLPPRM
jgi:hypothetical protein